MRELARESKDGRFVRKQSEFREWVDERPEAGRYELIVSLACPWASRTLIVRALKRLEDVLDVVVVDPIRDERGWRFFEPHRGWTYLGEAYEATQPGFDARITVPVLWDTVEERIVSNESADLVRMLGQWSDAGPDLYPSQHAAEIDEVNAWIYDDVNNGVYKSGFATSQEAYEEAFDALFAALDRLEERLSSSRFLVGSDEPTEADWRLFVTLVRFDAVYVGHFKCNRQRIADFPALSEYLRDLYQHPGIAATVDLDHIKRHYYATHPSINPTGSSPRDPKLDLERSHTRSQLQITT